MTTDDRPTDEEVTELHLLCQAANPGGDYEVMRLGYAAREWLPRLLACIAELEVKRDILREAFRPIEREMDIATKVPVLSDYKINGEPALLIRLAQLNALRAAIRARPAP